MKKTTIWILLTVLILSACTLDSPASAKDDPKPTGPTKLQEATQPHSPSDNTTEPTQVLEPQEPWYTKIKMSRDFDVWCIRVTEWNKVFYYITEDGLYGYDPITEDEKLLVAGDIRGLYVFKERFYYYTEFEIFELELGENNIFCTYLGTSGALY